jgi:hypothetical protein
MATGEHYTVTITAGASSYGDVQNVFVYEQTAGTGNAHTLADAFISDVLAGIVNIISSATVFTQIDVVNLEDPADFWTEPITEAGALGGDFMPPFVAAAFEYVRATRSVSNGRKSFGWIPEDQVNSGFPISGYLTALNLVATTLGNNVDDVTTSSSWEPVIWRRPGTYVSGVVTDPGLFYPISAVVFKRISSQNTRKIGRGS